MVTIFYVNQILKFQILLGNYIYFCVIFSSNSCRILNVRSKRHYIGCPMITIFYVNQKFQILRINLSIFVLFSHLILVGFYMYIETSNPRSKGHKAWLKSKEYTPTRGRCLSFWYHMLGQHIGTLNVLTSSNGSRSAPIWTLSGLQGPYWRPARVTIRSSVKHNVSIFKTLNSGD